MNVSVSHLNVDNLLALSNIPDDIDFKSVSQEFYCYLLLNSSNSDKAITCFLRGSLGLIKIDIEGSLNTELHKTIGIRIKLDTLTYLINQYSKEQLDSLVLHIKSSEEDNSFIFQAVCGNDTVNLPCVPIQEDEIHDIENKIASMGYPDEEIAFLYSDIEDKPDFIDCLSRSYLFMGREKDKSYNSIALLSDRFIVKDSKHIYTALLNNSVAIPHNELYLILYRLVVKTILFYANDKNDLQFFYTPASKKFYIQVNNITLIIDNSICNLTPPTLKSLDAMVSPTIFAQIELPVMLQNLSYFAGFFSGIDAWKSLYIHAEPDAVRIELKSSGVGSAYATSATKRYEITPLYTEDNLSSHILYDSLVQFLASFKKLKDPPPLEMKWSSTAKAISFSTGKHTILIPKLVQK